MQIMNPDWTCEERGDGKLLRDVKVIKHTDISSYLKLKADGYKTIWTGEGKIALINKPQRKETHTMTIENDTKEQRAEKRKAIREAVKFQEKLEAVKAQPKLESLTITIEWKKSRMWGMNPHATGEARTTEGKRLVGTATASGCGYCKGSTVIADLFNQFLRHKLYDSAVLARLTIVKPYGISLIIDENKYLSGFDGGIGEDCYSAISKAIGGTWKRLANTESVDVYEYKEIR